MVQNWICTILGIFKGANADGVDWLPKANPALRPIMETKYQRRLPSTSSAERRGQVTRLRPR